MEVEKILNAGSAILEDVMTAVETNQYQDLGRKISDRVTDVTSQITNGANGQPGASSRYNEGPAAGGDDTVYSGTVEKTNRRDGVYRTNFNDGAFSTDAYTHRSSERRTGPVEPNSSSRARMQGTYSQRANRAGYDHVYGNGPGQGYAAGPNSPNGAGYAKGQYGQYDYRNPNRRSNMGQPGAYNAGNGWSNSSAQPKGEYGKYDPHNPRYNQNTAGGTRSQQGARTGQQGYNGASNAAYKKNGEEFFAPTPFNSKNVSKNKGIGSMVTGAAGMAAGGVGLATTGMVLFTQLLAGSVAAIGGGVILPLLGGLLFTGASGALFSHGKRVKDTVSDYYMYGRYVGNAEFFDIKDLASKIGIQEKKLKKNLKKMMSQGLLPQARLDDKGDMMLLTDKAYDQYRQAAEGYKKRQEEDEKRENYFTSADTDETVKELLKEGNEYLKKVRNYNDLIPDKEMTEKLSRLETIMYRIFEQVKNKPDTAQSLRKFMEYYLPTTEKLLSAYVEVDKQPQVGDNITNTKKEIETAMDTINDAFEKLLDSLFEDLAWDISSDISVMKTMLEQDGLT